MERIDPFDSAGKYARWKHERGQVLPGVPEASAKLIRRFLWDLERGVNTAVGSARGPRSPKRLLALRHRLSWVARQLATQADVIDLSKATEDQVHALFTALESGAIRKGDGEKYRSTADFVKDFKTFWHWWMRLEHREGRTVADITTYLDTRKRKPPWVYLTNEEVQSLCAEASARYRVLIMFLLDSGVRSPSELVNIRAGDFDPSTDQLHIREETSKTFGRRIKLLLSVDLLRAHIAQNGLHAGDPVFQINPAVVNRYLKRLAVRVLGDRVTKAGGKSSELTMYDFRHISACYWLPRYKSESALKYRFGWKKTERIHYYTELLGMRDTIEEQDVLLAPERTDLERRFAESERQRKLLEEQIQSMQAQMQQIAEVSERLLAKAERVTV